MKRHVYLIVQTLYDSYTRVNHWHFSDTSVTYHFFLVRHFLMRCTSRQETKKKNKRQSIHDTFPLTLLPVSTVVESRHQSQPVGGMVKKLLSEAEHVCSCPIVCVKAKLFILPLGGSFDWSCRHHRASPHRLVVFVFWLLLLLLSLFEKGVNVGYPDLDLVSTHTSYIIQQANSNLSKYHLSNQLFRSYSNQQIAKKHKQETVFALTFNLATSCL